MNETTKKILDEYVINFELPRTVRIVDIGSHYAEQSVDLAMAFDHVTIGDVELITVDPLIPFHVKEISQHVRRMHFPVTIGPEFGNRAMYIAQGHEQSSSMRQPKEHTDIWPDIQFKRSHQTFPVIPFGMFNRLIGSRAIDVLWIDVNGYELDVIANEMEVMKSAKMVFIETSGLELYDGQASEKRIIDVMMQYGFREVWREVHKSYNNILFIRK